MPGESISPNISDNSNPKINEIIKPNKTDISVDELSGRTCYFSLSGDLAFKAFENIKFSTFKNQSKNKKLKKEFIERLNFAIVMFDHVLMHCSDPLRNEIVLEVLEENLQWITQGKILFVFSRSIKNIQKDYSEYIDRKINEYQDGYCSENEANSLQQKHITETYKKRVISLLDNTPYLIRKPQNELYSLGNLVLEDLNTSKHHEQVVIDSSSDLSQILSLSLSLHQLLNIKKYEATKDSNTTENVFPVEISKKVIKTVKEYLQQGNRIARVAIVYSLKGELEKKGSDLTDIQESVLEAISLRMDVLYCHMNSGKQMVLEFHPSYEQRSIYQLTCFQNFLKILAESDKDIHLTVEEINRILSDSYLQDLRLCYLISMADTHEHINLAQHDFAQRSTKTLEIFNEILKNNINLLYNDSFNSIKRILGGEIK